MLFCETSGFFTFFSLRIDQATIALRVLLRGSDRRKCNSFLGSAITPPFMAIMAQSTRPAEGFTSIWLRSPFSAIFFFMFVWCWFVLMRRLHQAKVGPMRSRIARRTCDRGVATCIADKPKRSPISFLSKPAKSRSPTWRARPER